MDFSKWFIRCSSLSKIMAKSSGLTEKEERDLLLLQEKDSKSKRRKELEAKKAYKPQFDLSSGAMTFVEEYVDKIVYEYNDTELRTLPIIKGIEKEDDSIELYNTVFFTSHKKNQTRLFNEYITGECDILATDKIIDIKTSADKKTFPKLERHIKVGGYEWQGRGYMMLYNKPKFELAFCLVDTPDDLIEYDPNTSLHFVEDLAPELCITTKNFERDESLEEQIKYKVTEARKYAAHYYNELQNKNR